MKKAVLYMMLLLQSCIQDNLDAPLHQGTDGNGSCLITVEVERPEQTGGTRSSFADVQTDKIYDLNIFIYHNGRLLKEYSNYFTDMSAISLILPFAEDNFNIYMLGNVGKIEPPGEECDISKLCYVIDTYDDFISHGFPVAAAFIGYKKGDHTNFKVKKMVGQYNIRIGEVSYATDYHIKDVKLCNCAKDIYPFGTDIKASVISGTGDRLTQSDLALLNAGEVVTLYFVENMQGVLLPDNTDRKKKIPSSIELIESGAADRCTYLEITTDISTISASYTDGKYRFYLGQDETTDFNIKRNTLHNVTLNFSQNVISEEEWRIEIEKPEFVNVKISKTEAMVIKGAEDMVFIQAFDNWGRLMDFDVSTISAAYSINVRKSTTYYLEQPNLGRAVGLKFTSKEELKGLYPMEAEPTYSTATVRISSKETYNGKPIYTKDIKVRVYNKLFPLLIRLEKLEGQQEYSVVMTGQNPMKLGIALSASYRFGNLISFIPEVTKARYMENQVTHSSYVSSEKTEFGRMLKEVTTSNLSRISFTVRGFSGEGDKIALYPRLLSSNQIFMGPNSEALFGPDESMCPAILPNLSDDAKYYMWFDQTGDVTAYDTDYESTIANSIPFSRMNEGWITPTNRASEFPDNWSDSYFYAHYQGVHLYRQHPNASMYNDFSQYEDIPFYFVNGGLIEYQSIISYPTKIVRYPNYTTRGAEFQFYGCGRDLFAENSKGEVVNPIHYMKMLITTWKPMIGSRINTHQKEKAYYSQLYMTINGASCWCGNDTSKYGYYPQ